MRDEFVPYLTLDVPEHFDIFNTPLSQLLNYNTRNGFYLDLSKPRTEWGRRTTYFRAFNDWASLPIKLNRPMLDMIIKRNFKKIFR